MKNKMALTAMLLLPTVSASQTSQQQAEAVAGQPRTGQQQLALRDVPRASGRSIALFDGHSLSDWTPWLGFTDPSITYRAKPGALPVGTSRDTSNDFAVREVDGEPAIWIKGQTWGSLVHRSDLRNYHLRLQYKWRARTWAPRADKPQNNGLLYHTHGVPGEVFGTWQPSIEFEIMKGSTGMLVTVGTKVRAHTTAVFDPSLGVPHLRFRTDGRAIEMVNGTPTWNVEAARDAERPAGEWNTLDLYVLGDHAIHVVNGVPVAEATNLAVLTSDGRLQSLTHGHIQLQSEGAETWFRKISIEPISSMPKLVAAAG